MASSLPVEKKTINSISINERLFCLHVATNEGYELYDIQLDGKISLVHRYLVQDGIQFVERINKSALVLFVPTSDVTHMKLYNFRTEHLLCQYKYISDIQRILVNEKSLVVLNSKSICVHGMTKLEIIHCFNNLTIEYSGSLALSAEKSYLAFPCQDKVGEIIIFNTEKNKYVAKIKAHSSAIVCSEFDHAGERIATASVHGTIIRVVQVPTGQILHQLRRGLSSVRIQKLSFSQYGDYLATSSSSSTVHIFNTNFRATDLNTQPANPSYLNNACMWLQESHERSAIKIFTAPHTAEEKLLVALFNLTCGLTAFVIDSKGKISPHSVNIPNSTTLLNTTIELSDELRNQENSQNIHTATSSEDNPLTILTYSE